jgi:hypothetical protein
MLPAASLSTRSVGGAVLMMMENLSLSIPGSLPRIAAVFLGAAFLLRLVTLKRINKNHAVLEADRLTVHAFKMEDGRYARTHMILARKVVFKMFKIRDAVAVQQVIA